MENVCMNTFIKNIFLTVVTTAFIYAYPMVQDSTEALYLLQGKTTYGFIDNQRLEAVAEGLRVIREQYPHVREIYNHESYELNRLRVTICTDLEQDDSEIILLPIEVKQLNNLFHAAIQEQILNTGTGFVELTLKFDGLYDILTIKKRYEQLNTAGVISVYNCSIDYKQFFNGNIDLSLEGDYLQFSFYQSEQLVLLCTYNQSIGKLRLQSREEEACFQEEEPLLPKEKNCCSYSIF